MKSVAKTLLALLLITAMAAPLTADDKKDKKEGKNAAAKKDKKKKRRAAKKRRRRGDRSTAFARGIMRQFAKAEPTDEQKKKAKEIITKAKPKFAALAKKNRTIFTRERNKARRDALKKAKAEGLKGRARQALIVKALNLTTEEKETLKGINKERRTLFVALRKDILGLLTKEQKDKAGIKERKKRKKGAKKRRKPKKARKAKKDKAEKDKAEKTEKKDAA